MLQNLEQLFQFHHQLPVRFEKIVSEVILTGIDRLPGNLRRKTGNTLHKRTTTRTRQYLFPYTKPGHIAASVIDYYPTEPDVDRKPHFTA